MIISHATSELSESQQRWFQRFESTHPYENSGRWYGCTCGAAKDDPIHSGISKNDRVPSIEGFMGSRIFLR